MELAAIDDEDIEAFLVESYESLDQIEKSIIELEKTSNNQAALDQIYRSLHTLKGNCGFLPFPKLESLAHAGESLLSYLRDKIGGAIDGNFKLTPQIISTLLQTVDTIRQVLFQIKTTKHEGEDDYYPLIQALTQLQETPQIVEIYPSPVQQPSELAEVSLTTSESAYIRVNVSLLDQVMNLVGELVLVRNQVIGWSDKFKDTTFAASCQRLSLITTGLQEGIMKTRLQPISTIWQKFPRVIRDLAIANGKQVQVEMQGADIELDKSIIEGIKDPLTHLVRNCIDHGIELPTERTARGKSTTGKIFLKAFHENGKVNIEIGDDGQGLSPTQLKRRAQQLGLISPGQAEIMSDTEAINLIFLPGFSTTEQVTNLSGRGVGMAIVKSNIDKINGNIEIDNQPGKGTTFKLKIPLTLTIIPALIVTSGGDRYAIPQASLQELVRLEPEQALKNIEVYYDVPVYRLREQLIPLLYLNQILQPSDTPDGAKLTPNLTPQPHSLVGNGEKSKPLSSKERGLERGFSDTVKSQPNMHISADTPNALNLVIIQADNYQFGLVVDTIEDIEEIVVKPLGKQLKSLSLFAGATIMGDGKVALIMDVVSLARLAQLNEKQQLLSSMSGANITQEDSDRQMILLFQGPQGALMGIPIAIALRLERITCTAIEKVGNQDVVRIFDKIVPLIDLKRIFISDEPAYQTDMLQLIVVSPNAELNVGLVVERILDIVEESLTIKGIPSRPGVLFNAVIGGKITEILDVDAVIKIANPYLLQVSQRG
ncbi:chemotaxis protein CheW [Nostoc sp. FACHB-152]|uniref:chemotaxis protein CheA n=1 Tax=unclassified Nostoc TaxID=2593658 RepID=UPI001684CCC5|nr:MULTISPECIES: chemotaxis protein CheA [unclassified Nostoc]MBD2445775.1 chemotaxis protein CheW [Nostoc sp. FACHB-152]MBD2466889.1 chemotaxis protein CheW [Nostoc sp. FACHB-145]